MRELRVPVTVATAPHPRGLRCRDVSGGGASLVRVAVGRGWRQGGGGLRWRWRMDQKNGAPVGLVIFCLLSNFTVHGPNSQMGGKKMLLPLEIALQWGD
jgi:hypothetical protein